MNGKAFKDYISLGYDVETARQLASDEATEEKKTENGMPTTNKTPVVIKGVEYESISAAARALNIASSTFYTKWKRGDFADKVEGSEPKTEAVVEAKAETTAPIEKPMPEIKKTYEPPVIEEITEPKACRSELITAMRTIQSTATSLFCQSFTEPRLGAHAAQLVTIYREIGALLDVQ